MAEAEGIAGLDTSVAHPARVYAYWLGGADNFAADGEAAERVLAAAPGCVTGCAPTGPSSAGRPGTWPPRPPSGSSWISAPASRPPATRTRWRSASPRMPAWSTSTTTRSSCGTRRPCCAVPRRGRPRICRPTCAIPRRSWTVRHPCWTSASRWRSCRSECCIDIHQSQTNAQRVYNERVATPQTLRTREQVTRFFTDLELVDPGLVQVHQWRPDPGDSAAEGPSVHGAVARKP
jgi:hypothetical protein